MTSVNLNYLSKDCISKYGHIFRYWELRLQYMNYGGTEVSLSQPSK